MFLLHRLSQEEESGGSSTDMSICRSEALFSSMRDSAKVEDGAAAAAAEAAAAGGAAAAPDPAAAAGAVGGAAAASGGAAVALNSSLISDSLIDGACSIDFTEQVKVNKNHYQLTYSGHGPAGVGVMGFSAGSIGGGGGGGVDGQQQQQQQRPQVPPPPPPQGVIGEPCSSSCFISALPPPPLSSINNILITTYPSFAPATFRQTPPILLQREREREWETEVCPPSRNLIWHDLFSCLRGHPSLPPF